MYDKGKYLFSLAVVGIIGILLVAWSVFQSVAEKREVPAIEQDTAGASSIRSLPILENRSEIVFGVSISMGGKFQSEGERVIEGFELWKDLVNEKGGIKIGDRSYGIRIIYYDDMSKPEKVRDNIRRLIEIDHIDFLLGPFSSELTMEASRIAEQYGVILVESCGASEAIFAHGQRFTFAVLTSASWYLKDFFRMISVQVPRPETYGVLTMDTLFARSVAKGARIWGTKSGLKEVYFNTIGKSTSNFTRYLEKMALAAPDIIVFCGHYQNALDFTVQLKTIDNLLPKAVVMTLGPTQRDYVRVLGEAAEQMTGITQWVAESGFSCPIFGDSKQYAAMFEQRFGHAPTYQNAQASASCVVYQLALEKCIALNSEEVLKHIREMDTQIFYGKIKFDSRGLNIGHEMAVIQIQNGIRETIWPKRVEQATYIYPICR